MSPEHIALIKATVPVLREHGVTLTTHFYQRMLQHHPELKNTFNLDHQSSGMQPRALAGAVLAYAENIENPSALAKTVERITNKHVSLNIQPEQYDIVGEHLLHAISEVLNIPLQDELIKAWHMAYNQLAKLLIGIEQSKYSQLETTQGAWSGWRNFVIRAIEPASNKLRIVLHAEDGQEVVAVTADAYISILVQLAEQNIYQPQQFKVQQSSTDSYVIEVSQDATLNDAVQLALSSSYKIGDIIQVSSPQQ